MLSNFPAVAKSLSVLTSVASEKYTCPVLGPMSTSSAYMMGDHDPSSNLTREATISTTLLFGLEEAVDELILQTLASPRITSA